jgi:hypothetical protein
MLSFGKEAKSVLEVADNLVRMSEEYNQTRITRTAT